MNLRAYWHNPCRGTGKTRDRSSSGPGSGRPHSAPHYAGRGPRGGGGCGCIWEPCPGPHVEIRIPAVLEDRSAGAFVMYADPEALVDSGFSIESESP